MDGTAHDGFLYKDEAFLIRGAVFEVYRTLGSGFLEGVYQECLALELSARAITYTPQKALSLSYKGQQLRQSYVADFVCYDRIILELKVARAIAPEHRAQLLNYLRASEMRLGFLINFGTAPRVEIERFAL